VNKINVIGIGFKPLEKKAAAIVRDSDDVLVNSRLLEVFKGYAEYEYVKDKIIVHASVYETLDYIADNYQKRKISLMAAGDPMFFGIGRLVVERLGRDAVEVFPDLSSIQVAFSRTRETSNNALFVSLHGGPDPAKRRKMEHEIADLPSLIKKHQKVAILTDKVNTPEKIGEVLNESSVTRDLSLKMHVCEKIGYQDERLVEGTPEEIAQQTFQHPNVVIISVGARCPRPDVSPSDIKFGLKEDEIEHSKGLITKDEVRAVTLHKLRLPSKGVFWDIGAGSGSVSIEAAGLCPELKVYAIEKNEAQVQYINNNKVTFNAYNLEIIKGEAPEALNNIPAPDRVFIGGSSGKLGDITKIISEKMSTGIIIVNAVTLETLNDAVQSLEKNGFAVEIIEVSISRSKAIGQKRHMSALNPIFIVKGEKQ